MALTTAAALVTTIVLATAPPAAAEGAVAAPAEEAAFAAAINQVRANNGLGPLRLDGELNGIARSWSFSMAAAGAISHRSDLRAGVTSNWTRLGENVGVGPSVNELMTAFVASPGHFKNLVDDRFTHMGVGAVIVDGMIYTTHEFMTVEASASGSAPAPVTPTTVRPRTSAPRPSAPAPAPAPATPRRIPVAAAAKAVAAPTPPPAPPAPPLPAPRVVDVLDRLRGNPPVL